MRDIKEIVLTELGISEKELISDIKCGAILFIGFIAIYAAFCLWALKLGGM